MYAIGELIGEMTKPPSASTPTKIKDSYRWFSYFKMINTILQSITQLYGTDA
jgi:hypothetical protein